MRKLPKSGTAESLNQVLGTVHLLKIGSNKIYSFEVEVRNVEYTREPMNIGQPCIQSSTVSIFQSPVSRLWIENMDLFFQTFAFISDEFAP